MKSLGFILYLQVGREVLESCPPHVDAMDMRTGELVAGWVGTLEGMHVIVVVTSHPCGFVKDCV